MKNTEKTMDKVVALCKTRGFIFPGSDVYGGMAGTWDFGPLGVEYKNNVKKSLDCPAVIDGGRTLVPVRAIAQALGCEVVWHENIKVVEIVSSKK